MLKFYRFALFRPKLFICLLQKVIHMMRKNRIVVLASNSLTNHKFVNCSKLKAFADDKIYVTQKLKFVLGQVENIVGKGENAGYQHFLLFPRCFQKPCWSGALKIGIVGERVTLWRRKAKTI